MNALILYIKQFEYRLSPLIYCLLGIRLHEFHP